MLRSLFSGISGLRSHQTMMDVTGNNIANVNTAGFKSSNTVFEDTMSQMLKAAAAPVGPAQGQNGGSNPAQLGLGVRVAAVNTNFSQGAAQTTGRATDMMIQGDGFFVVNDGTQSMYTRAGAFSFDAGGKLVNPNGLVVQGWTADANGKVDQTKPIGDIVLPVGTAKAPVATSNITIGGNLDPSSTDKDITTSIQIFDKSGVAHALNVTFHPTADPAGAKWTVDVTDASVTPPKALVTGKAITFTDGQGGAANNITFDWLGAAGDPNATPAVAADKAVIDLSAVNEFGGPSTVAASYQDGAEAGSLQSFTISPDGQLIGVFSNGLKQPLAQVALASFNNPPGLEKVGGSLYRNTVNSGVAQLGAPGSAGRGQLSSGALEMSNVDLAAEFTNLIVAERGFQANSRVITTSDEILQDLVNLKR
ncbi:MAG: flagellar hook protein FlgE [Actinomycetes bacterium]